MLTRTFECVRQNHNHDEVKKPPPIPCPTCNGKGITEMPEGLIQALRILRTLGGQAAVSEVWSDSACDRVGITAINNRLESLRELGFVQRERVGKGWVYSIV